ncbi:MAG: zf-HC2 domain-containing protein [Jatrophihabitantaceae bacterium]
MRFGRRRDAITCRRAVELITDYLDGSLPSRQRAELEQHLRQCPHCSEYLAQLSATIAATGQIEADELSPQVRQTLIELYRQSRR